LVALPPKAIQAAAWVLTCRPCMAVITLRIELPRREHHEAFRLHAGDLGRHHEAISAPRITGVVAVGGQYARSPFHSIG
jgi:hypothetical protein